MQAFPISNGMKVILLTDVQNVGHKHDVKEVASGYASNFLIPRKLAEIATDIKVKRGSALKKQHEAERKVQEELLSKNVESLKNISIEINAKANEKGHLFKGIHKEDIILQLKEQAHIDIASEMIVLEHPIKEVGEVTIEVKAGDKTGMFTLTVVAGVPPK